MKNIAILCGLLCCLKIAIGKEDYCKMAGQFAENVMREHLYNKRSLKSQKSEFAKIISQLNADGQYGQLIANQLKKTLKDAYTISNKVSFREMVDVIDEFRVEKIRQCQIAEKQFLAKQKQQYRQQLQRQRQKARNACQYFSGDLPVYYACRGETDFLTSSSYAQVAAYILKDNCSLPAVGIQYLSDFSYICQKPRASSCSVLLNGFSHDVSYACNSCGGTRKWLAMFVASLENRKSLPKCW